MAAVSASSPGDLAADGGGDADGHQAGQAADDVRAPQRVERRRPQHLPAVELDAPTAPFACGALPSGRLPVRASDSAGRTTGATGRRGRRSRSTVNVFATPTDSMAIVFVISGAMRSADRPKPASVSPTASPFLSGNHFAATAIGQPYRMPTPGSADHAVEDREPQDVWGESGQDPARADEDARRGGSSCAAPTTSTSPPARAMNRANIARNTMNGKPALSGRDAPQPSRAACGTR